MSDAFLVGYAAVVLSKGGATSALFWCAQHGRSLKGESPEAAP